MFSKNKCHNQRFLELYHKVQTNIGDHCFHQVLMTYALVLPYSKQKPRLWIAYLASHII